MALLHFGTHSQDKLYAPLDPAALATGLRAAQTAGADAIFLRISGGKGSGSGGGASSSSSANTSGTPEATLVAASREAPAIPIFAGLGRPTLVQMAELGPFLTLADDLSCFSGGVRTQLGDSNRCSKVAGSLAEFRAEFAQKRVRTVGTSARSAGAADGKGAPADKKIGFLQSKEEQYGDLIRREEEKKAAQAARRKGKGKNAGGGPAAAAEGANLRQLYDVVVHVADTIRPAGKGYVKEGRKWLSGDRPLAEGENVRAKFYLGIANKEDPKKALSEYKLLSVWAGGKDVTSGGSAGGEASRWTERVVSESANVLVRMVEVEV